MSPKIWFSPAMHQTNDQTACAIGLSHQVHGHAVSQSRIEVDFAPLRVSQHQRSFHYRERINRRKVHRVKRFLHPESFRLDYESVKPPSLFNGGRVLHKSVDVLEARRRESGGLSLADLASQVEMPKPTVP